ncbi:MAG TPA: Lpg1974 family pore-forming outer membrane protein, partial [Chlamydiales bacterium]|nr:Lpg1974 family pore-forming outer membrane protein [Chlamydiales bacterium]
MIFGLSTTVYAGPEIRPTKDRQPHFAFAYPMDMHLANPIDIYFYVEGLALQGMESNLQFTITDTSTVPTQLNGKLGGFGQDESWNYNFGLRAGFGTYVDHDAWNFDFDWFWTHITNSEGYQSGPGPLHPIGIPSDGSTFLAQSSTGANWECAVNVFDATLGKPYYISRKVIFNPHFGLRFGWIDQEYNVSLGGTTPLAAVKLKADNDFFGIGARVGVDTNWLLGYGFKLFSNLSTSVLAGWFDIKQHFAVPETTITGKLSNEPQMVVPNLDLALGLDWGTNLANCKYYLDFKAGYEFQIWWNQWNMRQFTNGASVGNFINVPVQGDLTLNGFTFKIQLDM